jgi:hypothetical protein
MDIREEACIVLGQMYLQEFDSKKMVEWAVHALQAGYDSESLAILAGLDYDTTEERIEYFWKSVQELNLDIQKEKFEYIQDYAVYVAKAVGQGLLSPESGLQKMLEICRATNYDAPYISFYDLAEDLDLIKSGAHLPIFNPGITRENARDFIKKAFEAFLQ